MKMRAGKGEIWREGHTLEGNGYLRQRHSTRPGASGEEMGKNLQFQADEDLVFPPPTIFYSIFSAYLIGPRLGGGPLRARHQ